jgi:hypothetical protein
MSDAGEHKRWLRDTTHVLLTRFAVWRRRVKIGLVIGGALIAGVAQRFRLHQREEDEARDPVEPLRVLANALALVIRSTNLYIEAMQDSKHGPSKN